MKDVTAIAAVAGLLVSACGGVEGDDLVSQETLEGASIIYLEAGEEVGSTAQSLVGDPEFDDKWWEYHPVSAQSKASWEGSLQLPPGYVMTGIASTVAGNNVRRVRLEGRRIESDGSLGVRRFFYHGVGDGYEIEATAPSNQVIVGAGFNVYRDNVNRINLFVADWRTNKTVSHRGGCISVSSTPGCSNNETLVDQPTQVTQSQYIRTVATGLKINASADNMNRMGLQYGLLSRP